MDASGLFTTHEGCVEEDAGMKRYVQCLYELSVVYPVMMWSWGVG